MAAGPWPAWQPPPPKTSEPPPPQHELRRALQKKLATKLSLVTAQEYQQLRQLKSERGDELLFPELAGDALLPTCTVACAGGRAARAGAGGVSWDVRPSVCENTRMLLLEECRRELTEFSGQVHVHTVRERRQAEAWEPPPAEPPPGTPGLGSPEAINLNGDGGEAPLEAPLSKRPRRACRSGGGAKVTVSANGVDSIGHLKLLCYEKLHDCAPSQMCLYFEGRELLDAEQPLQDLGVLDGSTLQLYVDREVAPTDTAALEKLGTKGGKEAVVEASFVGSALLGGSCCAGSVQSDPMVIDSPA